MEIFFLICIYFFQHYFRLSNCSLVMFFNSAMLYLLKSAVYKGLSVNGLLAYCAIFSFVKPVRRLGSCQYSSLQERSKENCSSKKQSVSFRVASGSVARNFSEAVKLPSSQCSWVISISKCNSFFLFNS